MDSAYHEFGETIENAKPLPDTASQLFPVVYAELRMLAAAQLAREPSGLTLQPTALVHEAYLRLTKDQSADFSRKPWNSRKYFFAAAAKAMREVLVDEARKRKRLKRGGPERVRVSLDSGIAAPELSGDILALHEALQVFSREEETASQLVELRCFMGMSNAAAAKVLGISPSSADRLWRFARAWLLAHLGCD
jgi:RNA polymerase sigma factor (TIGR02999 family)